MQLTKQLGSALLTALFIMTLVAIVATAMSTRLQLDIYRTSLIVNHDKLYLASQAVTFWSFSELSKPDIQFTKLNKEQMIEQYPKNMETLYSQVRLDGGLYDLQARFNLNNLVDKKATLPFVTLLSHVLPQSNTEEQNNIALALKNWLSTYDLAQGKDVFSTYYLSQKPPYYPSHLLMNSASEFRLIKDVSPAIYLAMEPFITVLPESTMININTAPKEVLMSLGNGLNEAQTNELIRARGENGITDLTKIGDILSKLDIPTEQITLQSEYYLSVAHAHNEEFNMTVYTVLKRSKDKKGKLWVTVISETINSL